MWPLGGEGRTQVLSRCCSFPCCHMGQQLDAGPHPHSNQEDPLAAVSRPSFLGSTNLNDVGSELSQACRPHLSQIPSTENNRLETDKAGKSVPSAFLRTPSQCPGVTSNHYPDPVSVCQRCLLGQGDTGDH